MPRKNIYVRNEDLPLWEAIENKPEWLHAVLNDTGAKAVRFKDKVIVLNGQDPLKYYDATTEKVYDASDSYEGLIYDTVSQHVFNEESREPVESDAAMIKELKKRGQVK